MNAITKMCNNVIFAMKRNAPAILLWVGIGTGAACVGKACYDTAKRAVPLLAKAKNDISEVKASVTEETLVEAKKKQMDICLRTAGKLGLIYMPSAALGLVSVASLITSHNIAHKRILGLSAAYAALGGLLGILLGLGMTALFGALIGLMPQVKLLHMGLLLAGAAVLGLSFGVIPAAKAAGLPPAQALRTE